jgi:3-dehydroquinate synthase
VLHGEAVAMGMALAVKVGVALGVTPRSAARELLELMDIAGLRYDYDGDARELAPLMEGDKKNADGPVTLVLLKEFGEAVIHKTDDSLIEVLGEVGDGRWDI